MKLWQCGDCLAAHGVSGVLLEGASGCLCAADGEGGLRPGLRTLHLPPEEPAHADRRPSKYYHFHFNT